MKKILFFCLLLLVCFLQGYGQQEKPATVEYVGSVKWTNLGPSAFAKLIADTTVQLLDVRTPAEYEVSHIAGAHNLDIRSSGFEKGMARLDPVRPVAVYCRGGIRSRAAARKLAEKGFKVYNLDKGYLSWNEKK